MTLKYRDSAHLSFLFERQWAMLKTSFRMGNEIESIPA